VKILYVTEQLDPHTEGGREYRITKAVNTVRYDIGTVLSRGIVKEYCGMPDWKIIITSI